MSQEPKKENPVTHLSKPDRAKLWLTRAKLFARVYELTIQANCHAKADAGLYVQDPLAQADAAIRRFDERFPQTTEQPKS